MFLKTLSIATRKELVREINFHNGLNLIVDESKSETDTKKSGNNIGKTTLLRLINFCLGGDGKSIWQDSEFKDKINETVKSFLINEEVVITLVLKEDLIVEDSKEITIRRNFLSRNKKLQEIDDEDFTDDKFERSLKQKLFGFSDEKPTFSQIKAKNIRDDAERLENTVKVLGKFGKEEEYEALYLFWLGVPHPDAEKKRALLDKKRIEDQLLQRLRRENSESKIEQFLAILQTEINDLEKRKNNFAINDNYSGDLEKLAQINAQLNELYTTQSQLELRRELIEESRRELDADRADSKTEAIAALYKQAKILIPTLQKTYEETVVFHNSMLAEKVRFITKELPRLEGRIADTKHKIQEAAANERYLKEKLRKAGIIEELQPIIAELNAKHERKGRLTEQAAQMQVAKTALSQIEKDLEILDRAISDRDELVQSRVKAFNAHFSAISERLYGEKFALTAPQEESSKKGSKFYKLQIDSLNGRPGTGKKKGEIASFDIAYVKFADEAKLPCLHFILHDQMEVVDHNQILGLCDEVAQANCQLVVPILRDKLPPELDKPEYQIVALSENNKLFRI